MVYLSTYIYLHLPWKYRKINQMYIGIIDNTYMDEVGMIWSSFQVRQLHKLLARHFAERRPGRERAVRGEHGMMAIRCQSPAVFFWEINFDGYDNAIES